MRKRIQIVAILILVVAVLYLTRNLWEGKILAVFSLLASIIAFLIAILIFLENRNPSKTITWLIVLAVNPVIGFVCYLLFGQSYRKKRMFKEKAETDELAFLEINLRRPDSEALPASAEGHQQLFMRLANRLGRNPISIHSDTEVLSNGQETFTALLDAIAGARHHIHLEYYIVRDDQLGNQLKDMLVAKAREGVEIRFLYDAVGCWGLSRNYIEEMNAAGVRMLPFLPVTFPLFNNRVNFRNHRKIAVIDSKIGFVGGLNIGDEYLGKNPYFGFWRDTHLVIRGEAVQSLQLIFLQDWFYMSSEKLLEAPYLIGNEPSGLEPAAGLSPTGAVQLVSGGPDHEWEVIKKLFFAMINSARHSVYIASPYFIPDEDILSALKVAALSGVDVRLLVPSKPDKRIVFYASRSYFTELLSAGIRIFSYTKGFMHSKMLIVDRELASIGTANMDMRSFHLNFEVNCFLYRTPSVSKLVGDYLEDLTHSEELSAEQFSRRSLQEKVVESLARLSSPLL